MTFISSSISTASTSLFSAEKEVVPSLSCLPDEILMGILERAGRIMPLPDFFSLRLVCKKWDRSISDNLTRHRVLSSFGREIVYKDKKTSLLDHCQSQIREENSLRHNLKEGIYHFASERIVDRVTTTPLLQPEIFFEAFCLVQVGERNIFLVKTFFNGLILRAVHRETKLVINEIELSIRLDKPKMKVCGNHLFLYEGLWCTEGNGFMRKQVILSFNLENLQTQPILYIEFLDEMKNHQSQIELTEEAVYLYSRKEIMILPISLTKMLSSSATRLMQEDKVIGYIRQAMEESTEETESDLQVVCHTLMKKGDEGKGEVDLRVHNLSACIIGKTLWFALEYVPKRQNPSLSSPPHLGYIDRGYNLHMVPSSIKELDRVSTIQGDGNYILLKGKSTNEGKTVVWDIEDKKEIATFPHLNNIQIINRLILKLAVYITAEKKNRLL